MEEVYRLFDRRCRMATALAKLEKLRARLRRFGRLRKVLKKLLAPGLEKALVFLDERLLVATSNAVERGNRRYRKMQKTVYRVRTQRAIEGRLALDLLREQHAQGRARRPPRFCTRRGRHDAIARYPCYSLKNVGGLLFFEKRSFRRAAGQSLPENPNRSTHSWESKRAPNYRRFS